MTLRLSRERRHKGGLALSGQAGFTLVELMVAMVLGLFIVLALITLLINVNRNNTELSKTNRVIENGRFTFNVLQEDVSHAGFWGGYVPQFDDLSTSGVPADYPSAVPDPCLAFASWTAAHKTNLIGIAVQGYEIASPVPSPTLSVCSGIVTNPRANTDVLVVRHVATSIQLCVPGAAGCATGAGELYFQVANCGTATPSPAYVLDSSSAQWTLMQRDCTTAADLRQFASSIYYVRDYAVTAGDGIPTLMRSQFGLSGGLLVHQAASAVVEGVEGFRVEYGVDNVSDSGAAVDHTAAINWASTAKTSATNRGDGIPDGTYVRCTTASPCTVAQLANTVAVKVYVLVRSENTTLGYTDAKTYTLGNTTLGPFNDGYKRRLFTQVIRLTNVSMRRETP